MLFFGKTQKKHPGDLQPMVPDLPPPSPVKTQIKYNTLHYLTGAHTRKATKSCHSGTHQPRAKLFITRTHCMHCMDATYCYKCCMVLVKLCLSVCWAHGWAVPKQLNRLRYCSDVLDGVEIPCRKGQLLWVNLSGPLKNTLLRYT